MSSKLEQAKELIKNEEYKKALDIAKKRHGNDKINEYLIILDLLIQEKYLPAIEERGHYHQYYDPNHDNGEVERQLRIRQCHLPQLYHRDGHRRDGQRRGSDQNAQCVREAEGKHRERQCVAACPGGDAAVGAVQLRLRRYGSQHRLHRVRKRRVFGRYREW